MRGHAVVQLVREVSRRQIAPRAAHHEHASTFPAELFALLAELDVLGLPFDPADGGGGHPSTVVSQILTELSQASLAVGLGAAVHLLATGVVSDHAGPVLRDEVLPRLVAGEWLASCPLAVDGTGGSGARSVRSGDDWVVNGSIPDVTHAGDADCYVVFCTVDGGAPADVAALLIPGDAVGLESSRDGRLTCRDLRIPDSALLGAVGEGREIAADLVELGRLGVAACAVGLAHAALRLTVSAVRAGGAPRETVTRVADLAVAVEAAESLCQRAAAELDAGRSIGRVARMAELLATGTARDAAAHAREVVGDIGEVPDEVAERYLREATALERIGGSRQQRRLAVARELIGTPIDDER